jgi:eukaryotic-like serine/threonine-protein kinase
MHAVMGSGRLIAGRYRLEGQIGRGAMGIVWRGRDELLARDVAVKEVQITAIASAAEAESIYQRTLREARAAARLSHPAVVTVFDVVAEDGSPWIVMELVNGRSLDRVIIEDGPLTPLQASELGARLVGALASAHAAGVLHRDVKPSNVLVTDEGRTVLTDFGIATFAGDPGTTQVGMVVGTPGFTAPERVRGGAATPASDLWSLGATLYAAVEGRGPFDRLGGATAITAGVATQDAPRAPSAGPLGPVIDALLGRDPATRPDATTAARLLAESATTARTDAGSPWPTVEAGWATRDGGPTAAMHGHAVADAAGAIDQGVAFLDPPVFAELSMPDLAGAEPPGANLAGADLAGAEPPGANLAGADLAGLEPTGFKPGDEAAARANAAAGIGAAALIGAAAAPAGGSEAAAGGSEAAADGAGAAADGAGVGGGAGAEPEQPLAALDESYSPVFWEPLRRPGAGTRGDIAAVNSVGPSWGGLGETSSRGAGGSGGGSGGGDDDGGRGPWWLGPSWRGRRWRGSAATPAPRRWKMVAATGVAVIALAAFVGWDLVSRVPTTQALGSSTVPGITVAGGSASSAARPSGSGPAGHQSGSPAAGVPARSNSAGTSKPNSSQSSKPGTNPSSRSTSPSPSSSPSASPSPSPSPSPAGPVLPAGYVWHRFTAAAMGSTAGFEIGMPILWQQSVTGLSAYLNEPATNFHLTVNLAPWTDAGPLTEAQYLQAKYAKTEKGYKKLILGVIGFKSIGGFEAATAAELEFSWTGPSGGSYTELVVLVTLTTKAGVQPYSFTLWAPSATFGAAHDVFLTAMPTFRPLPS